jgi:hypothetical protein
MANVFVSHRGADHLEAERLGTDLRDMGHCVWLDAWELRVGDSIVEKIDSGLSGAGYLILCYSDAGLSPWMGREWMSALVRQMEGADVRLLPVKLTGGAPPTILADIKYVDLVADWAAGLDALCAAIH